MFKGHKEARIYNITHFVTHMLICSLWYNCYICHFPWDACTTRCWWILLYFSIYGRGTPKIHHNRGKWGLLCKMRTKWGPFQQFGPHEDQVLNWGPFRTHCSWGAYSVFTSKLMHLCECFKIISVYGSLYWGIMNLIVCLRSRGRGVQRFYLVKCWHSLNISSLISEI